jgi:hypothetical protein
MYFDKYITNAEGAEEGNGVKMPWAKLARKIGTQDFGNDDISSEEAITKKLKEYSNTLTDGFSGREIEKVAIAWQAAAYGSESGDLSEDMMDSVIHTYAEQAQAKRDWR